MLAVVIVGIGILLALRFFLGGPEDAWLCVHGEWVAHGAPSAPKPTSPCGGSATSDLIHVTSPVANETVANPLTVTGEARGTWYFEASFPVKLYDGAGNLLAQVPARAQSDWMTQNFVPFTAALSFDAPRTAGGMLVLQNDNPSGDQAKAREVRIPIVFATSSGATEQVKLYYYRPALDTDAEGNIQCSRAGLVAVTRNISVTETPIQDTIYLLLKGGLTDAERARGITTEFPLAGLSLTGASLASGTLTLAFQDPNNKTSGGSCRAGILWFQIEATAKQFSGVTAVRFRPDTLFQP